MTTALRRAGMLAFVIAAASVIAAQQPPPQLSETRPAAGFILGRTVDGVTGSPIAGAVVSLNVPMPTGPQSALTAPAVLSRFPARVVSDAAGRFVFRELRRGTYTITAA